MCIAQEIYQRYDAEGKLALPPGVEATIKTMNDTNYIMFADGSELAFTVGRVIGRDSVHVSWSPAE